MPSVTYRNHRERAATGSLATIVGVACAILTCLPAPGSAQEPASASADAISADYSHIHQMTLDNGLDVIVVESHAVPLVTIEIAVHNGAYTETPELNGLSHLYEHMFFKANEEIPSQEAYLERQRELGMVWNGTTSTERVNYFFTVQSRFLEPGLEFMANAIRSPLFLEEELEREKEVVLGEFDRNEADPQYHLYRAMLDLMWTEHPTRKDSLGDRERILAATQEQMFWMQETYYVPNNSLLVLAGDVTPEQGRALAQRYLGDWASGPDPFAANPVPEHPAISEDREAVVEQQVQLSFIRLGWHGPDTRNDVDATYAADVFSYILGQTGSRFQTHLVESGITLFASLGYQTLRHTGPIYLTAAVPFGQEEAAIAAILEEIEHIDDPDYFTDEQLETAKTLLAVEDLRGQQEVSSFAHTLSYWWCSASIDYYLDYIERLAAVERADIERYVQTYIQGQPKATVLLTHPENASSRGLDDEWLREQLTQRTTDEESAHAPN